MDRPMARHPHSAALLFSLALLCFTSCTKTPDNGAGTTKPQGPPAGMHKKLKWNAEKCFDDPAVVALCTAIEKRDIAEIDRLVAQALTSRRRATAT